MAGSITQMFKNKVHQVYQEEDIQLILELQGKTREELEAIYVASMGNFENFIPLETEESKKLAAAQAFVLHWFEKERVFPDNLGELAKNTIVLMSYPSYAKE